MKSQRLYSPEVEKFQEAQLQQLREWDYRDLAALPSRQKISAPGHIRGIVFHIRRYDGDAGGVRIEVSACKRMLLIFLACNCPGFEMLPDGSILEDVDEPPED